MELKQLEILLDCSTNLKKALSENSITEKDLAIFELKNTCFNIKLENTLNGKRITYFHELKCNKSCEKCIVNGWQYIDPYLSENANK